MEYDGESDPEDKGFAGEYDTICGHDMIGSFWDVETSGQSSTSGNPTGKSTEEMKTQSTFTDAFWDFDYVWHMIERVTYPLLQWQPLPEEASVVIDLYAYLESDGWNFVSFNINLADTSPESILADIDGSYDRLMYYDASADHWKSYVSGRAGHFNNLDIWDHTMGVWIRMTEDATLTVEGYVPGSTDITLYPGWNMVGLPSARAGNHGLPTKVNRIGYFDTVQEYNVAYDYEPWNYTFEPGNGYWIYLAHTASVIWTADY